MDRWEVGDKAVCVWKRPANDGLEVGKVYTVAGFHNCRSGLGLVLADLPVGGRCLFCGHVGGWLADRFRKVKPDKHEAGNECEQLLDLLKKVPVDA